MQFSVDVLIVFLGFSIAFILESKPKHVWHILEQLLRKLCLFNNVVGTRAPLGDKIVEGQEWLVSRDDVELLTK